MNFIYQLPPYNSIKVSRFFLKPKSVYPFLVSCCRSVFFESDDRSLPLSRSGSSTLLRYKGNDYIVVTRHQLNMRGDIIQSRLDEIRISSGRDVLKNIPLTLCVYEKSNHDQEYHDIILFKAQPSSCDKPYFFPLSKYELGYRRASFMVGYPTINGSMDTYYEPFYSGENPEIKISSCICDCEYDGEFKTGVEHFKRYRRISSNYPSDGFSGGAIFSLYNFSGNYQICLDGIIVRANNEFVHIIDSDYLIKMFSHAVP